MTLWEKAANFSSEESLRMANLALISKVFEESYRERCAPKLDSYYPDFFNPFYYTEHWDYWQLNDPNLSNEYEKYLTMFPSFFCDTYPPPPIFGNGGAFSQTPWQNNCWLNDSRLQSWMAAKLLPYEEQLLAPAELAPPIWYKEDVFAALGITEWEPLERMHPPSRKWWKQMHDIHQLVGARQLLYCDLGADIDNSQYPPVLRGFWWYSKSKSSPYYYYENVVKFPAKTEYWTLSYGHTGMADGWTKIAEYAYGVTPPEKSYISGQQTSSMGYSVFLIIDYADAWQYYPAVSS